MWRGDADKVGFDFWNTSLTSHTSTPATLLVTFSEGAENQVAAAKASTKCDSTANNEQSSL
ncbi:hypothetical protein [Massilia sp. YIM B04103]|uniref:hypothetical protein n=1 Tax=Massilia sp. YIM B04103 TaxID=2963106 RepID=UPI0035A5FD12